MRPDIGGYADAPALFARAAQLLYPRERVPVSVAAERHRVLGNSGGGYSGPWTFEAVPFLRRPMDCLTDDRYRIVAVQGPAQCAKSTIGENWLLQSVIYDPANFVWCQVDKALAEAYVKEKIDAMVALCPEMRARLLPSASADTVHAKQFRGATVNFIWPVPGQFRMRSAPRTVLDDFDGIPEMIGGAGDPLTLIEGRQTTFEGREKTFVASSPELPAGRGIDGLVLRGTDETWRVRCPQCGARFALNIEALHFDRTSSASDAERSAAVICPEGCVIEPRQKATLVASGLWAGPDQAVAEDGTVSGDPRAADIASFRIDGLMGFNSWGRLARLWREAEIHFERLQDEGPLRAFWNTKGGHNYRSRIEGREPPAPEVLEGRSRDYALGTVPAGVRFLTAAIDVQAHRFAVEVKGWGADGESWLIDRFDILTAPGSSTERIDPATMPPHWDALVAQAITRGYPLAADPKHELPVACTAIDTGGLDGVTENAREFARRAFAAGIERWRIMLVKGANTTTAEILPKTPSYETGPDGKRRADAVALYVIGVHKIKNVVAIRLARAEPGAGYMHTAHDTPAAYFREVCAERVDKGLWVKTGPNESWDLEVYNEAARRQLREERINDWTKPPVWAQVRPRGSAPPPLLSAAGAAPKTRFRRIRGRVRS